MINLGNSKTLVYVKDRFIKEAYYGNSQLIGITSLSPTKSYNYSGGAIGANGYCEYKYPCTHARVRLGYYAGDTAQNMFIRLWDLLDGSQPYNLKINVVKTSNYNYRYDTSVIYNGSTVSSGSITSWFDVYFDWEYYYDFANRKLVFKYPTGSASSITYVEYKVSAPFPPYWADITNWSDKNLGAQPYAEGVNNIIS